MGITRKTIRERAAESLGVFLDSVQAAPDSKSIIRLANITDIAIDDERFQWYYVYAVVNDEFRLVTSVTASTGTVVVAREFTADVIQGEALQIYGLLNPNEWNNIIDHEVLPALFREDRAVIALVSGTLEYNITATNSWLTTEEQIIRLVNRDAVDGRQWRSMGLGVYRCPHCSDWHIGHSRGPNIGFFAGLHPEKAKARGKVG